VVLLIEELPYQTSEVSQPAGTRLLGALLEKKPATEDALSVGAADLTAMTTLGRFLSVDVAVPVELQQQKIRLLATLLGRLRSERAVRRDDVLADGVARSVSLARLTETELKEVLGQ